MTATRKTFFAVMVSGVVWGMVSAHTGTMGPISTYEEAIRWACAGEISEAFRTFWTAAEMFFCRNDFTTVVGLLSVAAHIGSVFALFFRALLCVPGLRDDDRQDF